MSAHDAFHDAILAEPAADVHRLVYADWLDETGDPANAALAEFIRLQCEAAALSPLDHRRDRLDRRAGDLFQQHWQAWWRPVCRRLDLPAPMMEKASLWARLTRAQSMHQADGWPYLGEVRRNWHAVARHYQRAVPWELRPFAAARFVRGFVDELDLSGEAVGVGPSLTDWLAAVPADGVRLLAQHAADFAPVDTPALLRVRRLELKLSDLVEIIPYVWSPNLRGVDDLALIAGDGGVSAAEINTVAASPAASRLRALNLDLETEAACEALAAARPLSLRALTVRLDLAHDDAGVRAQMVAAALRGLADSPVTADLERLSLSCFGDLSAAGFEGLCARRRPTVRALDLLDPLTPTQVRTLATANPFPHANEVTLNLDPHHANAALDALLGWPVLGRLTHLCLCIEGVPADPDRFLRVLDRLNGDVLQTLKIEGQVDGFPDRLPAVWRDRVWVDPPAAAKDGR